MQRQSDEVKHLLCALAFFERDVPKQALELLFDKKAEAAPAIARLTAHKLATTKTGLRGTTRYDLHAYFREQTAKNLLPQFAAWLSSDGAALSGISCTKRVVLPTKRLNTGWRPTSFR